MICRLLERGYGLLLDLSACDVGPQGVHRGGPQSFPIAVVLANYELAKTAVYVFLLSPIIRVAKTK